MKTTLAVLVLLVLLTSCNKYYAEPRYDQRDRIVGQYDMDEYSDTYHEHVYYDMYVSKNSYSHNEIYLEDLYMENTRVRAYVDYDRITIPLQVTGGYEFEGSGSIYNGRIELSYRAMDIYHNSYIDYCDAVGYRY